MNPIALPADLDAAIEHHRRYLRINHSAVGSFVDTDVGGDDGPEVLARSVGAVLRQCVSAFLDLPGGAQLVMPLVQRVRADGHGVVGLQTECRQDVVDALAFSLVEVALLQKAAAAAAARALPFIQLLIESEEQVA